MVKRLLSKGYRNISLIKKLFLFNLNVENCLNKKIISNRWCKDNECCGGDDNDEGDNYAYIDNN